MPPPSLIRGDHQPGTRDSFKTTLTAVCEAAVTLVGVDHSGLVLFSRDYEYGTIEAEYPSSASSVVGRQFPIAGVDLEQRLVHAGEEIVIQDVAEQQPSLGLVQDILMGMGVKSIVVVPIVVDDEVKGSFSFDSLTEIREFTEADVEKCKSLARFASVVLKNAYLLENLEALRKSMLAISSEPERVPLLQKITAEAVHLLQAEGGGIDEFDDRKGELTIVAKYNMPDHIVGKTMKVGEGLAGRIIERNLDSLTVEDYQGWDNKAPYFKDDNSLKSLIGVRLRLNQKTTGVLWLNEKRPRIFNAADVELLKSFMEPASIALEHSGLRDLERDKATRLHKLAQATNQIFVNIATSDRQKRLDLIAQKAQEVIDAELCGILLVERPGWLTLKAGYGYAKDKFEPGKRLKIESGNRTGLTGHIAWTGNTFKACGKELTKHPARAHHEGDGADYCPSGECYSLLGIPLKSETGELKGLISIHNKNDKDGKPNQWTCFTDDDEAIGGIFAQAALVAIETADLQDRYKTLLETSELIALARVPEDGLGALAKMVLREINKSFCRILFYHEADQTIQVIAAEKAKGKKGEFKWEQRLGEKTKVQEWKGLAESLETGQFVVQRRGESENANANLDRLSQLINLRDLADQPLKLNFMLRSPLKVENQIVGLLIIGELDRNADFSQFEVDLARTILERAARLIERLTWNKNMLVHLFETERRISTSADADEALKHVAETVYEVGRAYGRKVSVVDINLREGNKVKVVVARPEQELENIRRIVGHPFDLDVGNGDGRRGLIGRALLTGEPIIEPDVRNNPDYIVIHEDTLSQLVVPIKVGDDTVGAITVESSEASAFAQPDLTLVEGIAVQASSAISKEKEAREYKQILAVALAGSAARVWAHGLTEKAERLIAKIDEALNDGSDMRGALLRVKEHAQYLKDYRSIPLSSERGVADENLNEVLHAYLEQFYDHLETQEENVRLRVRLDQTKNCLVRINYQWFQSALSIFLRNASEAIARASEKMIEVETEVLDDSGSCRIRIRNTGERIPDTIWDKMGEEQIVRADGNTERGGGLLLANLILLVYGGKIEKINNQTDNICLGLTLPLVP
jgi:GAF domain-containing protein